MERLTIPRLWEMKRQGEPIVMLTAYNVWQTRLVEAAGADMILVGDSLGMVEHGYEGTAPVTLDMMILHCAAVMRSRKRTFVTGDMPFLACEVSDPEAVRSAGTLLKESGVDSVKVEGGRRRAHTIAALTEAGIAVMGHIGLTPQSAVSLGGFRVQGKTTEQARRLLDDARAVEDAGAFAVVLECVPAELASIVTAQLSIPTIGIGAGLGCDGQVLVFHDVLGLYGDFKPKFARRYAEGGTILTQGLESFVREVRQRAFPAPEHAFALDPRVREELEKP